MKKKQTTNLVIKYLKNINYKGLLISLLLTFPLYVYFYFGVAQSPQIFISTLLIEIGLLAIVLFTAVYVYHKFKWWYYLLNTIFLMVLLVVFLGFVSSDYHQMCIFWLLVILIYNIFQIAKKLLGNIKYRYCFLILLPVYAFGLYNYQLGWIENSWGMICDPLGDCHSDEHLEFKRINILNLFNILSSKKLVIKYDRYAPDELSCVFKCMDEDLGVKKLF